MRRAYFLKTGWWLAATAAAVVLVILCANTPRAQANAPSPACAGDFRHLSWTWQFSIDGSPQTIAQKLVSDNLGVIVKTHDGTDWMSKYDTSPDAVSGPAQVRHLADFFESRGVPFLAYA